MAQINDAAFAALRQLGYTGALPDMRYAFQRDIGMRLSSLYLQATGLPHVSDAALEFWSNPEYYPQPIIDGLYANGEAGTFSDIRTYATNYFSDAGTTPAAIGDPIYQINDQSGNGVNWVQATATARPILQSDSSGEYLKFDLGDDVLNCTLAAGTYTVVIPTREGIFFDEVTHAGGTFAVGPTSYTGGPAGILTALATGGECRLIGPPMAVNRSLTAAEQAALVQWFQNRGTGPELELGPELVTNGTFDSDISGWRVGVSDVDISWAPPGQLRITRPVGSPRTVLYARQDIPSLSSGDILITEALCRTSNATKIARLGAFADNLSLYPTTSQSATFVRQRWARKKTTVGDWLVYPRFDTSVDEEYGEFDNISLRKLQPKGV